MDAHAHAEEHFAGSNKLFTSIWVWLLLLTMVEIFLAYRPMSTMVMLTILLGLSVIKAALIIACPLPAALPSRTFLRSHIFRTARREILHSDLPYSDRPHDPTELFYRRSVDRHDRA